MLSGSFTLDKDAARRAIEQKIAKPLGISVEKAAYGIYTVVNGNMVNGVRRVSLEKGYDPRDFTLIAAGGATGAHMVAIANELGINTILVSRLASGLCAFGQIISDVKYDMMATLPLRLDDRSATLLIEKAQGARGGKSCQAARRRFFRQGHPIPPALTSAPRH